MALPIHAERSPGIGNGQCCVDKGMVWSWRDWQACGYLQIISKPPTLAVHQLELLLYAALTRLFELPQLQLPVYAYPDDPELEHPE